MSTKVRLTSNNGEARNRQNLNVPNPFSLHSATHEQVQRDGVTRPIIDVNWNVTIFYLVITCINYNLIIYYYVVRWGCRTSWEQCHLKL